MIQVVVSVLTSVHFALFSLVRSHVSDCTPIGTVLLYSEIGKFLIYFTVVACKHDPRSVLFKDVRKVLLPVVLFALINYLSFWSTSKVSSTFYTMLMQSKLLFTAFLGTLFLEKRYSLAQVSCILQLCISGSNLAHRNVLLHGNLSYQLLGTILLEAFLSSLCSVYMEKMFERSFDVFWVRSVEMSLLSILVYSFLLNHTATSFIPTTIGICISFFTCLGGILSACTLLVLGALERNIVHTASLVLVFVSEHLLLRAIPEFSTSSFCLIAVMSLINFNYTKQRDVPSPTQNQPLLGQSPRRGDVQ